MAVRLPGLHARGHRRPLRAAGRRPLPGLPVRPGHGRGPSLPVQRRRAASTGATSLLHTAVLGARARGRDPRRGAGRVRDPDGRRCSASAWRWPRASAARGSAAAREGLLAGALVALGGPVVWGFLYGADIALFMLLALWLLRAMLATRGPAGASAGRGRLRRAARALPGRKGCRSRSSLGAAPGRSARHAAGTPRPRSLAGRPPPPGSRCSRSTASLTGAWIGTSVADKSLFASYGLADGLALVGRVRRRRGARPAARLLPLAGADRVQPRLGVALLPAARPAAGRWRALAPRTRAAGRCALWAGTRRARVRAGRAEHVPWASTSTATCCGPFPACWCWRRRACAHLCAPAAAGDRAARRGLFALRRGAARPAGRALDPALRRDLRRDGGRRPPPRRGRGRVDRARTCRRASPWRTWPRASST